LPHWAQQVAWWVPMSHVFEYMRGALMGYEVHPQVLLIPLGQTILYLILAGWWFRVSFNKSLEKGLSRLE